MNEIWKNVKGYEELYKVSNTGKILNIKKDRLIKSKKNNRDYVQIRLYKDGKVEHWLLHRLVAANFIDNPNGYPQVNHIDEDKNNNNASNLEWCTNYYNRHYGTGYQRSVENHDYKKIARLNSKPVKQFDKDGNLLNTYFGVKEAERQTNINEANIRRSIRQGYFAGGYKWEYANEVNL